MLDKLCMDISRIFVVDNDPAVCTFLKLFLTKEGFNVDTAEDGLQALSALENSNPQVIFIDLVMPNISGEKLCQILRSQRRFDTTYLIVLSAISSEEEIDYTSIGFDVCIAKAPLKRMGEIILSVIGKLGNEITRDKPGGIYGLENLYRREITRELLSTKRHFELILGNMAESIIETSVDGRVVFANPAAVELLDIPEEILLSRSFVALFSDDQNQKVEALIKSAKTKGGTSPVSVQLLYRDRILTAQVLSVQDEGQISIVIIIDDITDKQRASADLKKAHDELESRVIARTSELAAANASLQVEIARGQVLEKKLRSSLKEKEILLDEIHHRVKNNLQIVSSLLGLNARKLEDEDLKAMVRDMRHRIQSLSLVHDKLYRSGNLAAVDIGDYFKTLIQQLVGSFALDSNLVKVKINIDQVYFSLDVAVPCALIVNELITNALKHAFPEGKKGEIRVSIKSTGSNSYFMEVGDNGIGLPEHVDPDDEDILGLRIVKVLASQLDAEMEIVRTAGTAFRFAFNERKQEDRIGEGE